MLIFRGEIIFPLRVLAEDIIFDAATNIDIKILATHKVLYNFFQKKKLGDWILINIKKLLLNIGIIIKKNSNFCKEERLPRDLDASSQDMHLPPSLNFNKYGKVPDLSPWFLPRKKKSFYCQSSGSFYCQKKFEKTKLRMKLSM